MCGMCTSYVSNNTGAVVVFDGYDGFSTKDEVHNRRVENYVGETVSVSQYMANVDITVQQRVIHITRYVLWTCRSAQTKPIGAIANDTDIFSTLDTSCWSEILLWKHAHDYIKTDSVHLHTEKKSRSRTHHFKAIWQGINKHKSSEHRKTIATEAFLIFF